MLSSVAVDKALKDAIAEDAVSVVINGSSYGDWHDVDMDSDVFQAADSFTVHAAIPSSDIVKDFREGATCDVYVGLDRQMSGVIDDVDMVGDRGMNRMTLVGRDKGAFLVDSEAPALKAKDYNVKTLLEHLIDPSFGIRLIESNEDNRKLLLGKKDKNKPAAAPPIFLQAVPRKATKIDPGQKIAQIIDIHTKRLGVAWWITATGDLFIGKPNYNQDVAYHFQSAAVDSREAKDNNVESWTVKRAIADRYSEITVNGVGFNAKAGLFTAASTAPKYTATTTDPDLKARGIVRKNIISDSDILSNDEARHRAETEMEKRRLNALVINLTVDGFRQDDRIYAVDTLASVKIEAAGIDGTFYVTQRRFLESRGKRRTSLTLHEKGVWLP